MNKPNLPKVIFGTSGLGNLYHADPYSKKLEIVKEYVGHMQSLGTPMFDSAGKYGAGLSLEVLGNCLNDLGIAPQDVFISNKLAWVQAPLLTPEPTFEPGVWKDIKHDAVQRISYDGMMECFDQGNRLLGHGYIPQFISVHDPDEYLSRAKNAEEDAELYQDILSAYRALAELKKQGKVMAIGVGAKDWKSIRRIAQDVDLDWVMIANSLTLHSHPKELIEFIAALQVKGVEVINSAVFNGGFLTGGDFYNYKEVKASTDEGSKLLAWRQDFFKICEQHSVLPSEACIQFGMGIPGIVSIAVSTSRPEMVKKNIDMVQKVVPQDFWNAIGEAGLVSMDVLALIR